MDPLEIEPERIFMKSRLDYLQMAGGVAALMIVLLHINARASFSLLFTPLGGIFRIGWSGVDFFFVLSGFIIYYTHNTDIGKFSKFGPFCKRRIIRIYPIYWIIASCYLLLVLLLKDTLLGNSPVKQSILDGPYLVKSYLLIHQVRLPFVYVAWSLCFELFFYAIFALGILLGKRVLQLSCLLYFICFFFLRWLPKGQGSLYHFVTSNYHVEFILGVCACMGYFKLENMPAGRFNKDFLFRWLAVSGLGLFILSSVCSFYLQSDFGPASTLSRWVYGLSSALIILGLARARIKSMGTLTRFLLLLGERLLRIVPYSLAFCCAVVYSVCSTCASDQHGHALWGLYSGTHVLSRLSNYYTYPYRSQSKCLYRPQAVMM